MRARETGRLVALVTAHPTAVHFDTDIGDNVDDALALALALASPELDLRAVSVTHGDNATLDRRAAMAATLLRLAHRDDIPVLRAIPPTSNHLVATGPLANVAAAFDAGSSRPASITVMGGMVHPEYFPAYWRKDNRGGAHLDHNTQTDPQAALRTAQKGIPITWIPIEVTLHTQLTTASLHRLQQAGTPFCKELARMVAGWSEHGFRHREHGQPDAVANLHDPLAMSALLPQADDWLTIEDHQLDYTIDQGRFRTTPVAAGHGHNARVATRVDAEQFERIWLDRVLSALG
jgi:purine nucleosidase